jgi:prophage regulatory protein
MEASVNIQDVVQYNQLLRIDTVSEITTVAKSSIRLWVAQGKFPKPITLSPVIKVWRLADINNWIEEQANV